MATKKITDLTLRSDFDETCNIPVDDSSQTWRTTGQQVLDFITGSFVAPNFFSGYFNGNTWNLTSTIFADFPATSGSPVLNTRVQNGLTLSAAGSDYPGVTFTPNKSSAVYQVAFTVHMMSFSATSAIVALELTDGTNVVAYNQLQIVDSGDAISLRLSGIYVPATTSPVTLKLRGKSSSGDIAINYHVSNAEPNLSIEIVQIF